MRTLAIIVVGLLIAAAIAWDASERHYDACVNAAKSATGAATRPAPGWTAYAPIVERRVKGCSRLPW